jgi:hypothetical protein
MRSVITYRPLLVAATVVGAAAVHAGDAIRVCCVDGRESPSGTPAWIRSRRTTGRLSCLDVIVEASAS